MNSLMLVAKSFFLTAVVVALLQLPVGKTTLEEKGMAWMRSSSLTETLRSVGVGLSALLKGAVSYTRRSLVSTLRDDQDPGDRLHTLKPTRSSAAQPKRDDSSVGDQRPSSAFDRSSPSVGHRRPSSQGD